jgi:hypothetical protein
MMTTKAYRRAGPFPLATIAVLLVAATPTVAQVQSGDPLASVLDESSMRGAIKAMVGPALWAQLESVQAKYLPLCREAKLLAEVSTLIERGETFHVLKIERVVVFATTFKGLEVARLVQNQMSVEDSVGARLSGSPHALPICLAEVTTTQGEQVWGFSREQLADGRFWTTVQDWNQSPQPSNVCAQSKALGGNFYASGGNGGYDDRRGVCWTDRCSQQYQAPRCH